MERAVIRWDILKIVTFKAPPCLIHYIDTYSRKEGISRSEIIRDALIEYLAKRGIRVECPPPVF